MLLISIYLIVTYTVMFIYAVHTHKDGECVTWVLLALAPLTLPLVIFAHRKEMLNCFGKGVKDLYKLYVKGEIRNV